MKHAIAAPRPPSEDLAIRVKDWSRRFVGRLSSEWESGIVEQLHAELDRLALDADGVGAQVLSDAAIGLSAYLCSFVDSGRYPDTNECARLEQLCDGLEAAARGEPPVPGILMAPVSTSVRDLFARAAAGPAREKAEAPPHVLCIAADPALVASVSVMLTEHGVVVTARSPTMDSAMPESGVQCVVVDAASIGLLHDLVRNSHSTNGGLGTRPTFIAVIDNPRIEERLRAFRAGADYVVADQGDGRALGQKLLAILSACSPEVLRVMIVDDERSQRMICASVLRGLGIETILCSTAGDALREFKDRLPDVVLIDLHMPEVDGLTLVDQLLETPGAESVSILFLSGNEEAETRFDALAAGGDDFLLKPIAPRQLIRAIWAHGRKAQRRRRLSAGNPVGTVAAKGVAFAEACRVPDVQAIGKDRATCESPSGPMLTNGGADIRRATARGADRPPRAW